MQDDLEHGGHDDGDAHDDVPLERDEEQAGKADARTRADGRSVEDILWKTRIRELNPKPPIALAPSASVADACARMRENRIGCVLVVDGGRLVGIFTERDVLYKVSGSNRRPDEVRLQDLMTPNPTTLRSGHRLAHALNKMSVDGCRHVPIVDESGRPTGVVSVRRIVDFLVEQFPGELLNLPPDPDQAMSQAEGG